MVWPHTVKGNAQSCFKQMVVPIHNSEGFPTSVHSRRSISRQGRSGSKRPIHDCSSACGIRLTQAASIHCSIDSMKVASIPAAAAADGAGRIDPGTNSQPTHPVLDFYGQALCCSAPPATDTYLNTHRSQRLHRTQATTVGGGISSTSLSRGRCAQARAPPTTMARRRPLLRPWPYRCWAGRSNAPRPCSWSPRHGSRWSFCCTTKCSSPSCTSSPSPLSLSSPLLRWP